MLLTRLECMLQSPQRNLQPALTSLPGRVVLTHAPSIYPSVAADLQLAVKSSKISHLTDKRIGPGVEVTTAEAPAAGDEGRPDKAATDDEQALRVPAITRLECLL